MAWFTNLLLFSPNFMSRVFDKNQTGQGIPTHIWVNPNVCGFSHTYVGFPTPMCVFQHNLNVLQVCGKNHTCGVMSTHVWGFPNTWVILKNRYLFFGIEQKYMLLIPMIFKLNGGQALWLTYIMGKKNKIPHVCGNTHTHKTQKNI